MNRKIKITIIADVDDIYTVDDLEWAVIDALKHSTELHMLCNEDTRVAEVL